MIKQLLKLREGLRGDCSQLRRLKPDPLNLLVNTSVGSGYFYPCWMEQGYFSQYPFQKSDQ